MSSNLTIESNIERGFIFYISAPGKHVVWNLVNLFVNLKGDYM